MRHEKLSDDDIHDLLNQVNVAVLADFQQMEIDVMHNNLKLHIKKETISTIIKSEDCNDEEDEENDGEQVSGVDVCPLPFFLDEPSNVPSEVDDERVMNDAIGLVQPSTGTILIN